MGVDNVGNKDDGEKVTKAAELIVMLLCFFSFFSYFHWKLKEKKLLNDRDTVRNETLTITPVKSSYCKYYNRISI